MTKKVVALKYMGGKSRKNLYTWINNHLGDTPKNWTYIEPFAGMAGILLSRPKADSELINDKDRWIYSWWVAIRDYPDELIWKIINTPNSREAYETSFQQIKKGPTGNVIDDALTAYIVLDQSIGKAIDTRETGWTRFIGFKIQGWNRYDSDGKIKTINNLNERLQHVQLENRDAISILSKSKDYENCIIYCDPPYYSTTYKNKGTGGADHYGKHITNEDVDKLTQLFKEQKGRVAISGYGDEWNKLNWNRYELEVIYSGFTGVEAKNKTHNPKRTEVLWCNFEPSDRYFTAKKLDNFII